MNVDNYLFHIKNIFFIYLLGVNVGRNTCWLFRWYVLELYQWTGSV